jgi:hypothetical protein
VTRKAAVLFAATSVIWGSSFLFIPGGGRAHAALRHPHATDPLFTAVLALRPRPIYSAKRAAGRPHIAARPHHRSFGRNQI